MTLKQILEKKNKRLVSIPDEFLSRIDRIQKQFFTELIAKLDGIERSNGFIDANYNNLIEAAKIDLREVLDATDYEKAVKEFSSQFDNQKNVNDDYFNKLDDTFSPSKFANEILASSKADAVSALIDSPLDKAFLKPIEDLLFDSVSTGASWKDTLTRIRAFAEGGDNVDGKLLQYSKQIAHDSFAYADAAYSSAIADELESAWFLYSGDEIPTSRCFCKERHGQYFHYKELEAFGRGENLGDCKSGNLWAGADPNTNEKTIFIYRGGFNCLHSIMAVSVFNVPKEVIQRNLDNGNYQPSDAELNALGL